MSDAKTAPPRILEIDVRGKRGVGFCKSMPGAVLPFQRVAKRRDPKPTDLIFPRTHHELFNTILDELGPKLDREGQRRTFYRYGTPISAYG
jgi:hypothetical protein